MPRNAVAQRSALVRLVDDLPGTARALYEAVLHTFAKDRMPKTPVGVEPTSNRFAGGRRAVWLQRRNQSPRQELNLVLDLRRVACESGTLRGQFHLC